jgi:hypothetical protein
MFDYLFVLFMGDGVKILVSATCRIREEYGESREI